MKLRASPLKTIMFAAVISFLPAWLAEPLDVAQAGDSCQRCYQLESKCRRESKGQANCDAIVTQCLRQCRKGR